MVLSRGNEALGSVVVDNESRDLLLTPEAAGVHAGSVNTTATAGGISGGASVGSGETFRVDFVTDLRGDPASTGGGDYGTPSKRDHVFDGHYTVNGSTALFASTSGSKVNFAAYDDLGGNSVVGDDPSPDPRTGILINYNNASLLIDLTLPLAPSYTVGGNVFNITERWTACSISWASPLASG